MLTSRQILKIPVSSVVFCQNPMFFLPISQSLKFYFSFRRQKSMGVRGVSHNFFVCFAFALWSTDRIVVLFWYFCSSASNLFCGLSLPWVKVSSCCLSMSPESEQPSSCSTVLCVCTDQVPDSLGCSLTAADFFSSLNIFFFPPVFIA